MRCILSQNTDPYFNLATEEYLLKNTGDEIFLIYINDPCIVVGKHQNLLSEINLSFVLEGKIKLARRISGGGTVYQDLNNLNFSFIHNCENLDQVNFAKFTRPVLQVLQGLGLAVEFSGRNDLMIQSGKISGNAMHIYKTRVLSHGTLLFDSDLSNLSAALKNNPQKYIDRSIKSVRSRVTNILDYLEKKITMSEFSNLIFEGILQLIPLPQIHPITPLENENILALSKGKFETWEWTYGYSPKYQFINNIQISDKHIDFQLMVEKGVIRKVSTNLDPSSNFQPLFELLINSRHDYHDIIDLYNKKSIKYFGTSITLTDFCKTLF